MSLQREQIEKTKKLSIVEGSATGVMTGFGDQYIIPFALRLGATSSEVGFLSSFPAFISALFQLLSAKITDKYNERKKLVVLFVLFQALSFIPLFILSILTKNFWILTICYTLYLIFGNIAGPAWSSWIGDVIPQEERNKYFGLRNKISILILFISVLASGIILNYFTDRNIWFGFGILFFIALIGRLISFIMFTQHYEPEYKPELWNDYSLSIFLKELRTSMFGNFVIFRSMLAFAVMITGPFFAVLMLRVFNFSYIQFSIIVLSPMIIKALTMTHWGTLSNKFGNKNILHASAVLISCIPLGWFISSLIFKNSALFYSILITEILSGFAWAGMELSGFNYMLEVSNPKRRVKLFAYYNIIFNFLVMLGGLLGSLLVFIFTKKINLFVAILIVIGISTIVRFIVAFFLTPQIKDITNHEKVEGRRLFYEVLVNRHLGFALSATYNSMAIIENKFKNTLIKLNNSKNLKNKKNK